MYTCNLFKVFLQIINMLVIVQVTTITFIVQKVYSGIFAVQECFEVSGNLINH